VTKAVAASDAGLTLKKSTLKTLTDEQKLAKVDASYTLGPVWVAELNEQDEASYKQALLQAQVAKVEASKEKGKIAAKMQKNYAKNKAACKDPPTRGRNTVTITVRGKSKKEVADKSRTTIGAQRKKGLELVQHSGIR